MWGQKGRRCLRKSVGLHTTAPTCLCLQVSLSKEIVRHVYCLYFLLQSLKNCTTYWTLIQIQMTTRKVYPKCLIQTLLNSIFQLWRSSHVKKNSIFLFKCSACKKCGNDAVVRRVLWNVAINLCNKRKLKEKKRKMKSAEKEQLELLLDYMSFRVVYNFMMLIFHASAPKRCSL